MTATVPTVEPVELRAGDTWLWERQDLVDYPAGTWNLKYALKNAASHIEISAAASGVYHRVTVAMATTLGYTAGIYSMVAYVESASERYEVERRSIEVLAAFANAAALDNRSHSRTVLDAIEAVIESRATLDQQEYTIGSRSLKRTPLADLIMLREKYRGLVYTEEQGDLARQGKGGGGRIVMRLK